MSGRTIQLVAPAEYQALLAHCTDCPSCRRTTERECPRAGALRRAWQAARRTAGTGGAR